VSTLKDLSKANKHFPIVISGACEMHLHDHKVICIYDYERACLPPRDHVRADARESLHIRFHVCMVMCAGEGTRACMGGNKCVHAHTIHLHNTMPAHCAHCYLRASMLIYRDVCDVHAHVGMSTSVTKRDTYNS
jgi:hypothetical protein